jgi:hypothetical protein
MTFLQYAEHKAHDDQGKTAYESINRLKSKGYSIKVSYAAVGELFKVLQEKEDKLRSDPMNLLQELWNRCKSNHFEMYCPSKEELRRYIDLVNRIRGTDRFIKPADALIIGQSMADKSCNFFLTFDRYLFESHDLEKVIRGHIQYKKYTITSAPQID